MELLGQPLSKYFAQTGCGFRILLIGAKPGSIPGPGQHLHSKAVV